MGIALTAAEKTAINKDTSLFEAASDRHLHEVFTDLQTQLDALPIDDTVDEAALADGAVAADKLKADLAALFATVDWGTPGAEAGNVIEVLLQLKDPRGEDVAAQRVFEVHVADTEYGGDSATATIAAAAVPIGTIISGSGTAAVKVQTDSDGQVALAVTEASAASRYLSARPCYGSPILDARDTATLTFA